jgi:prephenate dehydrogenase
MDMLVVGAGEMGRWLARTADRPVAVTDVDPAVAERVATDLDGVRAIPADTNEAFDIVCLAVPISVVGEAVERYAENADRAMCDVSGVMRAPVEAMRATLPDRERLSLHPLFAAANAPGNVAVVADAPGPATDALRADLRAAGNDPFETTVDEHDTAMETVQASAHTAVLAYALAAADVREEFATPVSAALSDLVETVTGGNARVYREIQETFAGADRVAEAARRIADADGEGFDDCYREAGERG